MSQNSERDLKAYNYAIGLSEYAAMDFSSGWDAALESDLLKKEREAMRALVKACLEIKAQIARTYDAKNGAELSAKRGPFIGPFCMMLDVLALYYDSDDEFYHAAIANKEPEHE